MPFGAMSEKDLEDLLFRHPYLIDEKFAEIAPRRLRRQVGRNRGRLDLLFDLDDGLAIVELKITRLKCVDVEQLAGYCREWSATDKLADAHFLIGKRPLIKDETELLDYVSANNFNINLFYLNEHLPDVLVLDDKTRRYRAARLNEDHAHAVELRF